MVNTPIYHNYFYCLKSNCFYSLKIEDSMAKIIRNDVNTLKAIAIVAVVLFHFFELVLAQYGNNVQDYLTSVEGG